MIGTTLSHYAIISRLGQGGMGEVYLAEDTQLGRRVAIKILRPETISDEHARKRLVREARSAATLDHPNICSIYEIGEQEGRSFIAMQYVECSDPALLSCCGASVCHSKKERQSTLNQITSIVAPANSL